MEKIYRIITVILLMCMLPVVPAMASSGEASSEEIAASAEPVTQTFEEELLYNDTTYGYGLLELTVTGDASSDGTIDIQSVTWNDYDVMPYMTDEIRAELEQKLIAAGVIPEATAASRELDSQPFTAKLDYNDTTYGYGNVKLKVTGSVFSDGTYQVDSVKCFGYELISYMTDDYYTELCGLLQDAGIVYEA